MLFILYISHSNQKYPLNNSSFHQNKMVSASNLSTLSAMSASNIYMYISQQFDLTYPVPACKKDENRTAARRKASDVIVMLKWRHHAKSHLSVFRNFWEPFLNIKMRYLMVRKKIIHYLCQDGIEKSVPPDNQLSSLGKPRDANRWSSGRILLLHPQTHEIFLYYCTPVRVSGSSSLERNLYLTCTHVILPRLSSMNLLELTQHGGQVTPMLYQSDVIM